MSQGPGTWGRRRTNPVSGPARRPQSRCSIPEPGPGAVRWGRRRPARVRCRVGRTLGNIRVGAVWRRALAAASVVNAFSWAAVPSRDSADETVEAEHLVLDGRTSTSSKPASRAYSRRVSRRITVPVPTECGCDSPSGRQMRMEMPYISCSTGSRAGEASGTRSSITRTVPPGRTIRRAARSTPTGSGRSWMHSNAATRS